LGSDTHLNLSASNTRQSRRDQTEIYQQHSTAPNAYSCQTGIRELFVPEHLAPYVSRSPRDTLAKDLKPVMFFIHGGGYATGTGSDPTYDGGTVVSRGDVVAVGINYRLISFSFLALDDGITNGNYGFSDAITALDWVRDNIRDFGGDSDRITTFGQSSSAATVRVVLASPKAIGKFVAAIPQSNLEIWDILTLSNDY
jgi:acetyl esterase/lipase